MTLALPGVHAPTPPYYDGGLASVAGQRYRAAMLSTKPVGYWRFGDSVAATSFADSSGGNHPSTRTGGTLGVAGLVTDTDTAYQMTGVAGDGGVCPATPSLSPTGPLTLSAWYRRGGGAAAVRVVMRKGSAGLSWWMRFEVTNLFIYQLYTDAVGGVNVVSLAPIVDANPHFAVLTYDGASVSGYMDSVLQGSTGQAGNVTYDGDSLYFGNTGAAETWDGDLDEFAIHNRALSPSEIAALYAAGI